MKSSVCSYSSEVTAHYIFASFYCSVIFFFFSSRRRHTRFDCDWSSDVCSSDLWDGLHSVPPPGPLPWGEGEWSAGSRSHPWRSLPNDHRLNSKQTPAVPSPRGRDRKSVV